MTEEMAREKQLNNGAAITGGKKMLSLIAFFFDKSEGKFDS